MEHNTKVFFGTKSGRCLWTNFTHCSLTFSSEGNRCINTPGGAFVFVQLTWLGPPAAQNFPGLCFFPFSAMFITAIKHRNDVTMTFWPCEECRKFQMRECKFQRVKNSSYAWHTRRKKFKIKQGRYKLGKNVKKSGGKISLQVHFNDCPQWKCKG